MNRDRQLFAWLSRHIDGVDADQLEWLAGDASTRRYARIAGHQPAMIAMDSPPKTEPLTPFVDIARRLRGKQLPSPNIIAHDVDQGFALLPDLGQTHLRDVLNHANVEPIFARLFEALAQWQRDIDASDLPKLDNERLQIELDRFVDWTVPRCQLTLSRNAWEQACAMMLEACAAQPQTFIHRDLHAENIMLPDRSRMIAIDFQDAAAGPLLYDYISLIFDRHWDWSDAQIASWKHQLHQSLLPHQSAETFGRWFDLTALQRNVKVLGIFCRLAERDGKTKYLQWLPRFCRHAVQNCRNQEVAIASTLKSLGERLKVA